MCRIQNKTEYEMRMAGINLSGGHTNSLELAQSMFGLPTLPDVLKIYQKDKEKLIEAIWNIRLVYLSFYQEGRLVLYRVAVHWP